jgi:hypothetical protein
VFNSYGDPIKILTNQGKNNSWGVSKFVWENINKSSYDFKKPFWSGWVN